MVVWTLGRKACNVRIKLDLNRCLLINDLRNYDNLKTDYTTKRAMHCTWIILCTMGTSTMNLIRLTAVFRS